MDLIKKKDGFRNERHVIFSSEINQKISNHPLIEGNYISEVGYYPSAKYHYRERTSGTSEYILIYCLDGAGNIEVDNKKRIQLRRGEIFCIPPLCPHRYYSKVEEPWSILWMHFHSSQGEVWRLNEQKTITIKDSQRYSMLQSHFVDLFDLGEQVSLTNLSFCASQLLRLILSEIYLLKDADTADTQNTYLVKCIKYMDDHISDDLTLKEIATYLDISPSYLSTLFKRYLNKSPIDYFIEMRIEQACKYLKLSDLKIYEVAEKVGYTDAYYFSRIFKKVTGSSPKNYRKNLSNSSFLS
ncbi:MAG TPA: AraC family transcriptional regulator [Candidatus Tetragenococcus pullicola]|nr:AraC family transcriptional regulator [Candidatus Tetragenococcus pullicola]